MDGKETTSTGDKVPEVYETVESCKQRIIQLEKTNKKLKEVITGILVLITNLMPGLLPDNFKINNFML